VKAGKRSRRPRVRPRRRPCDTLAQAVRSQLTQREDRMAGLTYRLEHQDGTPLTRPCCTWPSRTCRPATRFPLGADSTLRVVATRFVGEDLVLVVEPAPGVRLAARPLVILAAS
jgi:hypothetical protein